MTEEHQVVLVVRDGCGSCVRVEKEITPIVHAAGLELDVINVADNTELALEFGDMVPVVLLDGEMFAAWECDGDELARALR